MPEPAEQAIIPGIVDPDNNLPDDGRCRLPANIIRKAYDLRHKHGLSYGAIAKQLSLSKSSVYDAIKRFDDIHASAPLTEVYKEKEAELIDSVRFKILCNLADEDAIKKASYNNLGYVFQNLYNAQRLERGESTQNLAVHEIDGSLAELEAKRQALEAELNGVDDC